MILVIAVVCLVGIILVKYRRDSLELAYLCARTLRANLAPPISPTERCSGVTALDCGSDAWICENTEYVKINTGDAIPYVRLLATRKERGSSNQRVVFVGGVPQTWGHAKKFRVIPCTDDSLTDETSELCANLGATLDQAIQLLSQSGGTRAPFCRSCMSGVRGVSLSSQGN